MNEMSAPLAGTEEVRADFVPTSDYLSPEFAKAEEEHLWPKVWQIACRHEELPEVGSFVTYDIVDDSIIIVRTSADEIKAYHNVCSHRGRRLTSGCGKAKQFACPFHGWRFNLEGKNIYVQDREDWDGVLRDEDIGLMPVRAESWGGWVFVNMDPDVEPLHDFLAPVIARCDKYQFENLRFRWYKTVKLECNWKIVTEAFDEAYHIAGTHPELLEYTEDYTKSAAYGLHGALWHVLDKAPGAIAPMQRSHKRGGVREGDGTDYRKFAKAFADDMDAELRAMVTGNTVIAANRVMQELPPESSQLDVMLALMQFQREAVENTGAKWPSELTMEYMAESHQDWHVFPNTIFLHATVDGVLWYRARPDGHAIDRCIFDVWSLELYSEGGEPPLVREKFDDWREGDMGRVLSQDFSNVAEVQKGMRSRGFRGVRTNPKQEVAVSNFHKGLRDFMSR